MSRYIDSQLINRFKNKEIFDRKELFDFYLEFQPDLKEETFRWRIYDLKKKNIIKQLKRGVYTISFKPKYKPEISNTLFKLSKLITHSFDDLKYCVWNSSWLNEFSRHQTTININFVETEKDFSESVFHELKSSNFRNIYLRPDESMMELYIAEETESIILKPLISRAPLQSQMVRKVKIHFPSLEKILVDIFSEEATFYYVRGSEMDHIFENALGKYTINFSSLFSYARRRGKEDDLKTYLSQNLNHLIKDIIE